MKKFLYINVLIIFVFFTFLLKSSALSNKLNYININTTDVSLNVGYLSFYDILFENHSNTSSQYYFISGTINNNLDVDVQYNYFVYYYDSNYNLVAKSSSSSVAYPGINDFKLMSNLNILENNNVLDIVYYSLQVDIQDDNYILDNSYLTPSQNSQYSSYDYVIDEYNVDIIVNEDNSFDVTEIITVYFNIPKHGIFRTIPLRNNVKRLDGSSYTNRAQISNVSVDNTYTSSKEKGNYKLTIGSANHTLTGKQTYVIKYTYTLGKTPMKEYDELYYNLIGNEWDTVIGNMSFSITMPKEFDSSKLGFSSGLVGSVDSSKVVYNVNNNVISGYFNGILGVGEGLTVRCELEKGYFSEAKMVLSIYDYFMFIVPIFSLIVSVFLWFKFGRDNQVVESVEFYPPDGLNSLEVGFLFKGNADIQDVTSLLIYLANKGYLEIVDNNINLNASNVYLSKDAKNNAKQKIIDLQNKINEEKKLKSNSKKIKYYENMLDIYKNIDTPINYAKYGVNYSVKKFDEEDKIFIKKLRDYDGNDINEQWFMEGLFEYDRTEVTFKMLYNNFYVTSNRILGNINNKQKRDTIFEKSSSNKKIIIVLMAIISYCLITIPPVYNYWELRMLIFALLLPVLTVFASFKSFKKSDSFFSKIFDICWCLCFTIFPIVGIVVPALKYDKFYLTSYSIGIICILGMLICLFLIPKRTKYGNEMLGKLRGFKNFLETVEKEKLEAMVLQYPNYFYDILPYTYVLGISNKWIKKFEQISLEPPSWYCTTNDFDVSDFGSKINSTINTAQNIMFSNSDLDSSSSSGGSSGGGSSGGGSGGGGGGSW